MFRGMWKKFPERLGMFVDRIHDRGDPEDVACSELLEWLAIQTLGDRAASDHDGPKAHDVRLSSVVRRETGVMCWPSPSD